MSADQSKAGCFRVAKICDIFTFFSDFKPLGHDMGRDSSTKTLQEALFELRNALLKSQMRNTAAK